MARTFLPVLLIAVTASAQDAAAPAQPQDPLVQAQARLDKALATMAALPSCGFDAKWGPTKKAKEDPAGAMVVMFGGPGGGGIGPLQPGSAAGAWAQDMLHVEVGDDDLLFAGRDMLARDDQHGWTLRRGRTANGTKLGYTPDPQRLLDALHAMDLKVTHRQAAAVNDFPVEMLSVELSRDQVAELIWGGLMPAGSSFNDAILLRALGAAGVGKPAPEKPTATVDLAIAIDPGSGFVHRVTLRSIQKEGEGGGVVRGRVIAVGGGGLFGGGEEEEEEEEEAEAEQPETAPEHETRSAPQAPRQGMTYEDGLPVRETKKASVATFTVDFRGHGGAKLPALDERAKKLLRR